MLEFLIRHGRLVIVLIQIEEHRPRITSVGIHGKELGVAQPIRRKDDLSSDAARTPRRPVPATARQGKENKRQPQPTSGSGSGSGSGRHRAHTPVFGSRVASIGLSTATSRGFTKCPTVPKVNYDDGRPPMRRICGQPFVVSLGVIR